MEVAMADVADHFFSGFNFSAAADGGWPYWSPSIGWTQMSVEEEVHDMKRPMEWHSEEYTFAGSSPETFDNWSSSPVSETTFSSLAAMPAEELTKFPAASVGEKDRGMRLIHLLSAAAEALSSEQNSQELSRVILARLKELLPSPFAGGSSIERLALHFTRALCRLVDGDFDDPYVGPTATATAATQLFQDMSPYVNFGHFTANQAILEAVGGERRVHIVDFNIVDGSQWAPLMQAFVSMKDSPPPSHLKITAVCSARKSAAAAVQETGRMLSEFAASIGLPFSFALCRLDRDGYFRPAALKALRGEGVVFNCALHAPHHNQYTTAVKSFLAGAAVVGARLVTVVEEESGSRASIGGGFLGSFMEEVQRYLAILEALEAGFPKQGRAREMVENMVLGPRISGAVEMAFRRRDEEERVVNASESWDEWLALAGFGKVGLSYFNQWQAKLLLGLFDDGYGMQEDEQNKIVLSWKSRRLVSASVWSAPPPVKMEL